jgi:hypothetical protein
VDRLVRVLKTSPGYKVRLRAVITLGKLRARRAVPALIDTLLDRSVAVRGVTAVTLARIGDARALPWLRQRARQDRSRYVRKKAAWAARRVAARARRPKRFYVTVGSLTDGSRNGGGGALRMLKEALLKEFSRADGVTTRWPGRSPSAEDLRRRRMRGFVLSGSLQRLDRRRNGPDLKVSCNLKVSLATYPGNSIKALYDGETSLEVSSRRRWEDLRELVYRDLFTGAAAEVRHKIVQGYLSTL